MAETKKKPLKGKKTVASTLGYCRYCGLYYEVASGDNDPGNCGREKCVQKAGDINRIETSTTSGVTIVEFTTNHQPKSNITKTKVGDNMYVMDVRKEHVYSLKELEEMEDGKVKEEKPKTVKKRTTKKTGSTKKGPKSKKTNTKRVSRK